MPTTKMSRAEIERLEAQVAAGQRMAGEEESETDRALGRAVMAGELTVDEALERRLAEIETRSGAAD